MVQRNNIWTLMFLVVRQHLDAYRAEFGRPTPFWAQNSAATVSHLYK